MNDELIVKFREIGHNLHSHSGGRGSQKRILVILQERETISQVELTKILNIQPGSASEVIGKLESKKLIERFPSLKDNRTTILKITEEGKREALLAKKENKEYYDKMLKNLSLEEKKELLFLLEKINLEENR